MEEYIAYGEKHRVPVQLKFDHRDSIAILLRWCKERNKDSLKVSDALSKLGFVWKETSKVFAVFTLTDNTVDISQPIFSCKIECDEYTVTRQENSKTKVKQVAALAMLHELSLYHGARDPECRIALDKLGIPVLVNESAKLPYTKGVIVKTENAINRSLSWIDL